MHDRGLMTSFIKIHPKYNAYYVVDDLSGGVIFTVSKDGHSKTSEPVSPLVDVAAVTKIMDELKAELDKELEEAGL